MGKQFDMFSAKQVRKVKPRKGQLNHLQAAQLMDLSKEKPQLLINAAGKPKSEQKGFLDTPLFKPEQPTLF